MKLFLINLFLIFGFNILNISAQNIFFKNPSTINSSSLAKTGDMDLGDIDGDGLPDILIASKSNNSIFWIKNNENKTSHFDSLETITKNFYKPGIIKLIDIDKDGDLDFFVAGKRKDNISWFENINNGKRFSQHYVNNITNGISSLAIFDADQDGNSDLIVSYWEGSKISWFKNINGEFPSEKVIDSSTGFISQIGHVDIDGDGLEDILAIQKEYNKIVYYKNSDDSTRFSQMFVLIEFLNNPSTFATGDIDNDGDNDIILSVRNKVISYNNNGGVFGNQKEILNTNSSIEDIYLIDLDKDNDKDIVLGNSERGEVLSFINMDGNGNYSEKHTIATDLDGSYAIGVDDINNNDTLDLCVASLYLNKIVWFQGIDGANFHPAKLIFTSQLQEPKYMLSANFAGDNSVDILVSNYRTNSIGLYKNKDSGQSYEFKIINQESGKKDRKIVRADFDNDGKEDIVEAQSNFAYSSLFWYKNINETGEFISHNILVNNLPPVTYLTTADMDGDSLIDIIIVSETDNNVSFIRNKGQGKFDKDLILITNQISNPSMAIVKDINFDGKQDIIVSSYSNDYIYLFTNENGNFSFQQTNIPNPVRTPEYITLGDLDNDGDQDLIYSSLLDYGLFWMKNNNGSFGNALKIISSYYSSPEKILVNDIDLDNDMDLIVMDKNYNSVSWFENSSENGSFSTSFDIINGVAGLSDIQLSDINNDGLQDILSLSEEENNLYVSISEHTPIIIHQPHDTSICDTGVITLNIDFDKADSIRWQVMEKYLSYFESVYDDSIYHGTSSKNLQIKANPDFNSFKYRCALFYDNKVFFSDTAKLNIFNKIEANAGKDDTTCYLFYFLNANYPGKGIGVWSVIQGNAKIDEPSKSYTKVNNLSTGQNIFKWTITNGICQDFDEINIFKEDSIKILDQPNSTTVTEGATAKFSITTNIEGNYQWYFNGYKLQDNSKITGSTTSELTISGVDSTDIGEYRCYAEGYCNYIYSNLATLDITTSTGEIFSKQIKIYPNPVEDELRITSEVEIKNIEIWDINGNIIKSINHSFNNLDLSELKAGNYILKLKTEKGLLRYRFMKI